MKRNSSLRVLFIIVCFAFLSFQNVKASSIQQDAAKKLVDLKIMQGYSKDSQDLGLKDQVNRGQMVTFMMRILGKENTTISTKTKIQFKDVQQNHWARQAVYNAVALDLAKGYDQYTFAPDKPVRYEEVCAFMIRTLGKDTDLKGNYPDNYINKAKELGITKNLEIKPGQAASRGDVAVMVYNSLFISTK